MHFPRNIHDAKQVQLELKKKLKISRIINIPKYIAGVDAAFFGNNIIAVACLFKLPDLTLIECAHSVDKVHFPYIPGYLSFREGPAVIHAISKLSKKPDLIIFDGQGIAHPQSMGIASHIGILLDKPSIGCAKSRLIGEYTMPGNIKGNFSDLVYKDEVIGSVLRTRDNVKPVFVSPGHRIDIKGTVNIVLKCTTRYRLPEPIRKADLLTKELKRKIAASLP